MFFAMYIASILLSLLNAVFSISYPLFSHLVLSLVLS